MRWLIARDLTVIARTHAFWIAMAAQVAILAAYVVIWGTGIPIHGGRSAFEQFLTMQAVLLAAVLPWTGVRCSTPHGWNGAVLVSLAIASRPWRIVVARCIALFAAFGLLAAATLPLTVIVQQASALPLSSALITVLPLSGLCALGATTATGCSLLFLNRLAAWLVSTVVMLSAVLLLPPGSTLSAAYALIGILAALVVARWADGAVRYVSDRGHRVG